MGVSEICRYCPEADILFSCSANAQDRKAAISKVIFLRSPISACKQLLLLELNVRDFIQCKKALISTKFECAAYSAANQYTGHRYRLLHKNHFNN